MSKLSPRTPARSASAAAAGAGFRAGLLSPTSTALLRDQAREDDDDDSVTTNFMRLSIAGGAGHARVITEELLNEVQVRGANAAASASAAGGAGDNGGDGGDGGDNGDDDDDGNSVATASSMVRTDPFYVHIDVVYNSGEYARTTKIARAINKFMITRYYFDPRRYFNFLDDVFAPEVPNMAQMRRAIGMADTYYELWKVKADFSVPLFFANLQMVLPAGGFQVQLTIMVDNDHQIYNRVY